MRQRPVGSIGAEARTIDILTDIATRFYLRGESQIEIAHELGLDPSTVSRYLKRARVEGIVHIEIRPPRREDADLSLELATRYGLTRAIVAPDPGDGREDAVGPVAAEYVEGIIGSGMRVGVSWGRTLADVIRSLRPGSVARLRVAQLSGGVNDPTPGIQGTDIARGLADRYPDSRVHYLHAPAIVASRAIYAAILSDPSVESALAAARRTQVALVGIGQITPAATMYRGGHVDRADWATLVRAGAVGNMNTRFFDAAGRPVPALEDRTVAITWAEMRAIPNVIAVAAGLDKVEAISGALATGAIDSLITDEKTARALLER